MEALLTISDGLHLQVTMASQNCIGIGILKWLVMMEAPFTISGGLNWQSAMAVHIGGPQWQAALAD